MTTTRRADSSGALIAMTEHLRVSITTEHLLVITITEHLHVWESTITGHLVASDWTEHMTASTSREHITVISMVEHTVASAQDISMTNFGKIQSMTTLIVLRTADPCPF